MGGGVISDPKNYVALFGKGKALRAPISRTKAQHFFPKIGGGSEAVWKFSENSSDLEEVGFPKGLNSGLALYNLAGMRNSLEYR